MVEFKPTAEPETVRVASPAAEPMMPLTRALDILARALTRDDDLTGFVVQSHPELMFIGQVDYIRAWESVRYAIGLPTEPAHPYPGDQA